MYPDGRPHCRTRLDAQDYGVIFRHGHGPDGCDRLGAREPSAVEAGGVVHLFYDGAGPDGWLACRADSRDLQHWNRSGSILELGPPESDDRATASSPWVVEQAGRWHMFYVGSRHASAAPDHIPVLPYVTCKAVSDSLDGPWSKQPQVVPFRPVPDTYFAETASPGYILEHDGRYLQYFSAAFTGSGSLYRTLGLARTRDLNGGWMVGAAPILPADEQIENSSIYFEPENETWFLFTNHVGIDDEGTEYTDAIWVYWTKDPLQWYPDKKAVVLDGRNCNWSGRCVGMPSVVPHNGRLALFYDAPGGDSISHMHRDIGLAWLDLPLRVPAETEP